ncbi:diaminopropionate ammonia-lyase [Ornithinibacillus sp. 4-3]|uniref:Diaminopropionate ammonia-lyase n=1 Tax=Ornithinibacillus sp. 4-3 TaxID=3231488 RepID=A0AB39HP05_9BACI
MAQKISFQKNLMKEDSNYLEQASVFSHEAARKAGRFQSTHPLYAQTPLVSLQHLANHIGVKHLFVKDESYRFGLNAFKVLGGIYAIGSYLAKRLNRDIETLSFEELKSEAVKEELGEITFISATDGNHGKGVAWAARELGHRAVIYLPKGASEHREQAIVDEGAIVEVTKFNYDESVRLAAQTAFEKDWVVLQDTSWEGYEEIPEWIIQGYATLASEAVQQIKEHTEKAPTHVFLQAGVGSFAASVAAYFLHAFKEKPPKIILVEPHEANCYYRSFVSNEEIYEIVYGEMDTIMAGLACGEPNPAAWEFLRRYTDVSFSCDESIAAVGMRILGHPLDEDQRIIAGESGAVTAGLVYCLATDEALHEAKTALDLDENASIIVVNTEGNTNPDNYRNIVWEGAFAYQAEK